MMSRLNKLLQGPKVLSTEEIDEIVRIVNNCFQRNNKPLSIDPDDIDPLLSELTDKPGYLLKMRDTERNPLRLYLDKCAPSYVGSTLPLYHFKSIPRIIEVVNSGKIKLFNMHAQSENDNSELFEFYKRLGTFNFPEILTAKNNTFILSLTEHANSEEMWETFGLKDEGACLEVQFDIGTKHKCYDIRNVFYDSGYDIDFISDAIFDLYSTKKLFMTVPGHHFFSQYYKRDRYRNEREVRLSLYYPENMKLFGTDYDLGREEFLGMFPEGTLPNGKRYVTVPLKNSLFEIRIISLYFGSKAQHEEVEELLRTCTAKGVLCRCRKY
jgi:hypothetical protein